MIRLAVENLEKIYRRNGKDIGQPAVSGVSFEVEVGSMAGIVGRSGSGKTTLLAILAGLLTPTSGQVLVDGVNHHRLAEAKLAEFRNQRIGFVPQGASLISSLTVYDNILLPHSLSASQEDVSGRIDSLLEDLGLTPLRDRFPAELSGGEMRRAAIARALLNQPELLLADEPTGDLDSGNISSVMRMLDLARDQGATVVFSTHEDEAARRADRLFGMAAGKLAPV